MKFRSLYITMAMLSLFAIILLNLQGCKDRKKSTTNEKESAVDTTTLDGKLWLKASAVFPILPDTMPGTFTDTKQKVDLGKKLYFEKALSINNQQACNSCHPIDRGFAGADHDITGVGALGKSGKRNDPSTLNAGFQFAQFWDGRAGTLEEQATKPILNPIEMGMPDKTAVEKKLRAMPDYVASFKAAFPDQEDPLNFDNLGRAIAAFERTLVSRGKIDRFLKGDLSAMNTSEKEGLKVFIETGCIQCHMGPNFGGLIYQKMGLFHPYENIEDLGRFAVTGNEGDKYQFKVPMLRNVLLTGPYFHDGRTADVEVAIEKMAYMQLNKKLTPNEVKSIKNFLGALSDEKIVSQ